MMQCIHFKGFKHDSPFCLELQHSVPLKVNIAPSSLTGMFPRTCICICTHSLPVRQSMSLHSAPSACSGMGRTRVSPDNGTLRVVCTERARPHSQLVRVYKIPLTGPSRFTFVPVVRNSGADSQDVLLLDQEWSFEGPVTTFSRRRHARHHYHPVSTRPIPTTYPPSRSASDLKKRSHHAFRVYVIHSHDPDLPFNQELKALEDGPRITAEFIVVEHSEGGRRITNAKPADKSDMDRVVVSYVPHTLLFIRSSDMIVAALRRCCQSILQGQKALYKGSGTLTLLRLRGCTILNLSHMMSYHTWLSSSHGWLPILTLQLKWDS